MISEVEPKHIDDAMQDGKWIKSMQKELDQFQKNDVSNLVPKGKKAIREKRVFHNKLKKMVRL